MSDATSATRATPAPVKIWSMPIPIRWADMDAWAHVNHAETLRYFEEARVAWSAHHKLRRESRDGGFVVKKISVEYHHSLVHPGNIISEIFTEPIGNSSFTLRQVLTPEGNDKPSTTGEFVMVWMDYINNKPAPLPERLRAVLEGRES